MPADAGGAERHVLNIQLPQIPSAAFFYLYIYLGGWLDFIVREQQGHNSSQSLPVAMTTGPHHPLR